MTSPGVPVSEGFNRPRSDEADDYEGRPARSGCDWSRRFVAAPLGGQHRIHRPNARLAIPPMARKFCAGEEQPVTGITMYPTGRSEQLLFGGVEPRSRVPCPRGPEQRTDPPSH